MRWNAAVCLSVILVSLGISPARTAAGEVQSFRLGRDQVAISLPIEPDWQAAPEFLGFPLVLLGPESGGGRPVLSITPTRFESIRFLKERLIQNQAEYRQGREEWLRKRGGRSIAFFDPTVRAATGGIEILSVGYRYVLSDIEFEERSFYVICRERLFHLKSLLRAAHRPEAHAIIEKTVEGLRCGP